MRRRCTIVLALLAVAAAAPLLAQGRATLPLTTADTEAIATLLMLEDARTYDEAELKRIATSSHPEVRRRAIQSVGRIADKRGAAVLELGRSDRDTEVAATAAWAAGQLRDPAAVPWLAEALRDRRPAVSREAAIALGKVQHADARAALAAYLLLAPKTSAAAATVGEALLSLGRFPAGGDLVPVLRWTSSPDVEIRWRATWALFRPRDPAALTELLRLSGDKSADVRFWAVRGLIPHPNIDPAPAATRLRAALRDGDRRVRTEALRTLALHDDEESFKVVLASLDDKDAWISVSAAEGLARHKARADVVVPRLVAAAGLDRPAALRVTARRSLAGLGEAGRAALTALAAQEQAAATPAPGGRGQRPQPQLKTLPEYRQIVERWIVPDYNGAKKPRAILETARGAIELELYPGDAPLGLEYFIRAVESGAIVGTEFSRVVPNFVAQQQTIPNAPVLRDEVSRRGLTRGNLSWASAGLDTGRPGYTLGITPQPHNEGNFTALGRVLRGLEVVERLELGDAITAARMVR